MGEDTETIRCKIIFTVFVFEAGEANGAARNPFPGLVERIGGPRNRQQRVVCDHAGSHSAICGSHGRPAVDSPGSEARRARIAIRNDDCTWLPDAFAHRLSRETSHRDSNGRADGRELWAEPRAIPCAGSRGFKNSRALHTGGAQRHSRRSGSYLFSIRRGRADGQALLCSRMDCALLSIAERPAMTHRRLYDSKKYRAIRFRWRLFRRFEEKQAEDF